MLTTGNRLTAARGPAATGLEKLPLVRPVLPDTGSRSSSSTPTTSPPRSPRRPRGRASPGVYNLAAPDEITTADLARELGWATVPVPKAGDRGGRRGDRARPADPGDPEWINAFRIPVLMDRRRPRASSGSVEWRSGAETLAETIDAARGRGLI